MNYNIKGTEVPTTDELRSYVEKQLAHADKFLNGDTTAHTDVELQHLPDGRSGKYKAEFTLALGGEIYRAERWGSTMHEAIDLAGSDLANELSRTKKKKQSVMRRASLRVKEYLRGWRSDL